MKVFRQLLVNNAVVFLNIVYAECGNITARYRETSNLPDCFSHSHTDSSIR